MSLLLNIILESSQRGLAQAKNLLDFCEDDLKITLSPNLRLLKYWLRHTGRIRKAPHSYDQVMVGKTQEQPRFT